MINVDVRDLYTFQLCERKYAFEQEQTALKPILLEDKLRDLFSLTLRKIILQFYFRAASGQVMDTFELVKSWEKAWFPRGTTPAKLAKEQHNRHNYLVYSNHAVTALRVFRENLGDKIPDLEFVDESYSVPIKSGVLLSGKIDLAVREGRHSSLILLGTARSRANIEDYRHHIAGMIMAYRNMTEKKEAQVFIHNIAIPRPGRTQIHFTDQDLAQTKYWVERVSIEKDFAPRREPRDNICRPCPYKDPCWNSFDWMELKERSNV